MTTTLINYYSKGSRIWRPDPDYVWRPAVVAEDFKSNDSVLKIELEQIDDEDDNYGASEIPIKDPAKDLPLLRNPKILEGKNNLTELSHLHEPAVLHNLAIRFELEQIYTYCGIVLVAFNPYQELHIYGHDTIETYRNKYESKGTSELDPHIYAVAGEAFTKMERDDNNQSIIVSGESGAGKTVSAKYAMRYFATVGGTDHDGNETQVERRVLASSPIMEAIGNAKTTRNDNSSRFGKYIEIDFDKKFHIIGANMRTYLLEKSRVVFQANNERNYHIFYQLCAGKNEDILADMHLGDAEDFHYLNQGENPEIDGVDDRREFKATLEAFRTLHFTDKQLTNAFRILAGILHLGDVEILPGKNSETSSVSENDESLRKFAELLEVSDRSMMTWLCQQKIVTARDEVVKNLSREQAKFAKNALAKFIYETLFNWIVERINAELKTTAKMHKFIGVLDIYGFETFDRNSFEQFCINYANEKLQQQFNQHVFKLEQELYVKENIQWERIDWDDNQECINLIESKQGILSLLDSQSKQGTGTDKNWLNELHNKCLPQFPKHYIKPRLNPDAFMVRHFADAVEYECEGFLAKNKDTVYEDQIRVLRASKNDFVKDLFDVKKPSGSKSAPAKNQNKSTVGTQFGNSLGLLMKTLNSTTPHYVRCIKPNDEKVAFMLDRKRGIQQLRACGVLETVRISAAGFPSRWTFQEFAQRYRVLCNSKDVKNKAPKDTCQKIVVKSALDEDKVKFGKTKLFFRAGLVAHMEKLRSDRQQACITLIQKTCKAWLYRRKYLRQKQAAQTMQRWIRGFLARRRTDKIRKTKASITIQKNVRGWLCRVKYHRLRNRTVRLQARVRGVLARKAFQVLRMHKSATIIQKNVRMWQARKNYVNYLKAVILAQSLFRRTRARKELKKLKIEAKSVEHQKKLNQGLENKIISLQQKFQEEQKKNKEMAKTVENQSEGLKEIESLKKQVQESKESQKKALSLADELERVKAELEKERSEKLDAITQLEKNTLEFKHKEEEMDVQLGELKTQLEQAKRPSEESNVDSEAYKKLEEDKAAIHSEYEQERIAYQKLLKDFNRLEAHNELLEDELTHMRGGTSMSNMSELDDSVISFGYGSQSARSSMRSNKGFKIGQDKEDGGGGDDDHNEETATALNLKLQQKLKEAQRDKERLEKKLEELESGQSSLNDVRQTSETVKLQELEVENARLTADLKKIRQSISDQGDAKFREMIEQYEQLQEELDRRREECVQLRTVLANVAVGSVDDDQPNINPDDPEELFAAYEAQKRAISQLQDQLNEERLKAKETVEELKLEAEKLNKTCDEQQRVIQATINKGPVNNTEACLQHEITRLTGENFDLRERIETLSDTVKRQKKQMRNYMKKLNEFGGVASDNNNIPYNATTPIENLDASSTVHGDLPVIRKKEHDFQGMFDYSRDQEEHVMKALISDLKPKIAVQMLPGLPAYVLFMMIRHTDHVNDEKRVRSLIQGAIALIKKVIKKKGANDLEYKTMWLANLLRILHNLKQYSGEKQFQLESSPKQVEQCLRNFDLSEYRRVISDIAIWIYQGTTKLIEEEIQPILVPAVLEHEGIGGISSSLSSGPVSINSSLNLSSLEAPTQIDPKVALDKLLRMLTRFHSTLTHHGLDPEIISQIFKQVFYFICAGSLNNLLLRKDMCHWSRGMQIRYNIAQLEQWARDQKIQDEQTKVIETFEPLIQASQLLQARKDERDVDTVVELCSALKVSQIIKILNLYTPHDDFEERVTPQFVRLIQAKLKERQDKENEQQITLLMDTKFSYAVKFPFSPSKIQLEELEVPEIYNNLHNLLTRV